MSKLRWGILPLNLTYHDGDDPLAVFDSSIDFLPADFGFGRIRADEKEKDIRFLDTLLDLPPPIHGGGNALPVDPEIQTLTFKGFGQFVGEFDIFAGVGDKYAGQGSSSLVYLNNYQDGLSG